MENVRTGQLAILGGGVLILISTFLDWAGGSRTGWNVYDSDIFGFTGILLLLLALDLIAVSAIRSFAPQIRLPDEILGFTLAELTVLSSFAATIWGLSIATADGSKNGAVLCFVGGLIALVGSLLEVRADDAPSAPPTTI